MNYVEEYYAQYDEDARFLRKSHETEYLTTMHYIQKYLFSGARILEIGVGTGRYSCALAKQGYSVDAVELLPKHIEILKRKSKNNSNLHIYKGNAVDLDFIDSDAYDIVLLLGPMYHLFSEGDKSKALAEAIRAAKPNGIIFAAYCNNDTTVYNLFLQRQIAEFRKSNTLTENFQIKPLPEIVFAFSRKTDIDCLMRKFPVHRLHFVGTDMLSEFFCDAINDFSDSEFSLYMQYHFQICERADCVGMSFHFLDVFQKDCNNL